MPGRSKAVSRSRVLLLEGAALALLGSLTVALAGCGPSTAPAVIPERAAVSQPLEAERSNL